MEIHEERGLPGQNQGIRRGNCVGISWDLDRKTHEDLSKGLIRDQQLQKQNTELTERIAPQKWGSGISRLEGIEAASNCIYIEKKPGTNKTGGLKHPKHWIQHD